MIAVGPYTSKQRRWGRGTWTPGRYTAERFAARRDYHAGSLILAERRRRHLSERTPA